MKRLISKTNINREQMAVLMAKYANSIDLELEGVNSENTFEDHAEISPVLKRFIDILENK